MLVLLSSIAKDLTKPESLKDVGIAAAAVTGYFVGKSWQDVAGDITIAGAAILVVLRILYLLWQWVRGKKPD